MENLKCRSKKWTVWLILTALLAGSFYWSDWNEVSADELSKDFVNYITSVNWTVNGGQALAGDSVYQMKQGDTLQAVYEYKVPSGMTEETMELPVAGYLEGTVLETSPEWAQAEISGQKVLVKITEGAEPVGTVTGAAADSMDEPVLGRLVIQYVLHSGLAEENSYIELIPDEINSVTEASIYETPNPAVPEFLSSAMLLEEGSIDKELVSDENHPVEKNAKVGLRYDFKCASGENLSGFTVSLPPQVQAESSFTYDLTDKSGVVLCKAEVKGGQNGTITFQFTEACKTLKNIEGFFVFDIVFIPSAIGKGSQKEIAFVLDHKTVPISVYFRQPAVNPEFQSKSAKEVVLSDGTKGIEWITTLKAGTNVITEAEFTEVWNNQELFEDLEVSSSNSAGIAADIVLEEKNGNGLKFKIRNFGNYDENDIITIKYKTKADGSVYTNPDGMTLKNTISVSWAGMQGAAPSSCNEFQIVPKIISQTCDGNLSTGELTWTVTLNESQLSMYQPVFSTDFDEFLKLKSGSVYVKVGGGSEVQLVAGSQGYAEYANGKGFSYNIAGKPLTDIVVVKFITEIKKEFFQKNRKDFEFSIGAKLVWHVADADGKGIESLGKWAGGQAKKFGVTVFQKEAISYDASKGEIKWKITVSPQNPSQDIVSSIIVTDEIVGSQKFVEDSVEMDGVKIPAHTGGDKAKTYTYDGSSKVEINIGDITHNKETIITLRTKIDDANIYRNGIENFTYENKASIGAGGITAEPVTSATKPVKNDLLVKTSRYIQNGHEIEWAITMNEGGLPIKDAVLTDDLPLTADGQSIVEYVPGSFSISKKLKDGSIVKCKEIELTKNMDSFTYQFSENGEANNNITDGTYTIIYRTKIVQYDIFDQSGKTTVKNIAQLSGYSILDKIAPLKCESERSQEVKVEVISKKAEYKSMDSFIKWTVTVNEDERPLKDAVITDDLSSPLMLGDQTLDTSGMTLVRGSRNGDGSWNWSGAPIDIKKADFSYDAQTKIFQFFLADDADQSEGAKGSAYRLTFITKINDKSKYDFDVINKVSFQNKNNTLQTGESQTVKVSLPKGGASGSTPVGKLTVTMKAEGSEGKLLQGAEFELLDKFDIQVAKKKTDQKGTLIFEDLTLDAEYKIKQVTPAPGYPLITDSKIITAQKDGKAEFQARILTTDLSFEKTDSDTRAKLSGAKFGLYAAADTQKKKVLKEAVSNAAGKVEFMNIPYGDYSIGEITPPPGYRLSSVTLQVKMTQDTAENNYGIVTSVTGLDHGNEFGNSKFTGSIQIKLTDKTDSTKVLSGGEFELYGPEGELKATALSGVTGLTEKLSGLPLGDYKVIQTKSPEGYWIEETPVNISLTASQEEKLAEIKNEKVNSMITVEVTTKIRPKELEGVDISLFKKSPSVPDELLQTKRTNRAGRAVFINIPAGSYEVRQMVTPAGCVMNEQIWPVTVAAVTAQSVTVINQEITGSVTVKVTAGISGMGYTLYYEDGTIAGTAVTDRDGNLRFENVIYGSYKLRQTFAPSGYQVDATEHELNIQNQGEQVDIVIQNVTGGGNGGSIIYPYPPVDGTGEEETNPEPGEEPDADNDKNEEDSGDTEQPLKPEKPAKPDKPDKNGGDSENRPGKDQSGSRNDGDNGKINSNGSSGQENADQTAGQNGKDSVTVDRLPQSGGPIDFTVLAGGGLFSIIVGAGYEILKKKHR